ncbi:MAG: hypothetical protein Q4E84_00250 [Clostridia bacterium]|nr:hypothetical protein [Clostridia bacterium]
MRVRISKSKLGLRFYIIKTYYNTKGIERTITVEKLGSEQEIREKTGRDPMEWAKERATFLTQQEKSGKPRRFFHAFSGEIDYERLPIYLSGRIPVPAKDFDDGADPNRIGSQ